MAMRAANHRALASALRSTRSTLIRRTEIAGRTFTTTQHPQVVVSKDQPNQRHAQREADVQIHQAPVNPADKYAAKADAMHKYGAWLMGCLPKYIQQFSVWKDELVIYISPSGVIPVFTFLKCKKSPLLPFSIMLIHLRQHCCRIHPNLRHYSRGLPHSRPAIRGGLQYVECASQLSDSNQDVRR